MVDLTLTADELLTLARQERWTLGAAATYVRRAGFWTHYDSALADCLPIFDNVNTHEPDLLAAWLITACVGVAEHVAVTALHHAFALVADTIADHLAVDAVTRDVLRDAVHAAADTLTREQAEQPGQ